MSDKYDELYDEISTLYTEEARTLLDETTINNTLVTEKNYIMNAKKAGISPALLTGSNTARYCKDMLRKDQPLYPLYMLLGLLTQISYFLMFWTVIKCIALYALGHRDIFTTPVTLSFAPYIIAVYVICSSIISHIQHKTLSSGTINFNALLYRLIMLIIMAAGSVLIWITSRFEGLFSITLLNIFLLTVALLFISGVHNVIYSSHIISFFNIGISVIKRSPDTIIDIAVKQYITLTALPSDSLLARLKNNRIYYAAGEVISAILCIICTRQIFTTKITVTLAIFDITLLFVVIVLAAAIISCNQIIRKKM